MPPASDLTDRRFGRLVARRPVGAAGKRGIVWECDCDCGTTGHPVPAGDLTRRGNAIRSCGCVADAHRRNLGSLPGVAAVGESNLAAHKVAPQGVKACPCCGGEFEAVGRQVYCSEPCRAAGAEAATGPDTCAHCGGPMDRRGYARRYCEMACKRQAARAAAAEKKRKP